MTELERVAFAIFGGSAESWANTTEHQGERVHAMNAAQRALDALHQPPPPTDDPRKLVTAQQVMSLEMLHRAAAADAADQLKSVLWKLEQKFALQMWQEGLVKVPGRPTDVIITIQTLAAPRTGG